MHKKFDFIKSNLQNLLGAERTKNLNSQTAGIITETEFSSGPVDSGTNSDKIAGFVNMDGLSDVGKGSPSGGFMEKIANALSSILGLTNELEKSATTMDGNSDETIIKNSNIKEDTTFLMLNL